MVVAVGIAVLLVYRAITESLPPVEKLAQYRPPVATQVLADDGSVVGEFYVEKRYVVPIERIPDLVRNAFLAAEDADFYRHRGVDPVSVLRAFVNNVVAGGRVQGGSTITQQVVKSLLLSPRKSYERKLKEMILATRLEGQLSKDEILSLYLNHIYLGSGAYGVAAAAQEYFGKPVESLSLAEAALLAGLPQAPSRYSPFKHWPRAKTRQRYVLDRMAAARFISASEAVAASREPIALATRRGNFLAAPHYVEHVRRLLDERYGGSALYAMGLRVHTALNLRMQAAAEAALRDGLIEVTARQRYGRAVRQLPPREVDAFLQAQRRELGERPLQRTRGYEGVVVSVPQTGKVVRGGAASGDVVVQVGGFRGPLEPDAFDGGSPPPYRAGDVVRVRPLGAGANGTEAYRFVRDPSIALQGAFVALDPATGAVKAMVGGNDFDSSQFNRAVQGARQPGSAFKPLIYAAALDGEFTPASVIVDEPIHFADRNRVWSPRNYEQRYYGPTTLRDALTFSRNVVTVKVATRIGMKPLTAYIKHLGIQSRLAPNLSLALGSSEVNLLELAAAYAVFANQGQRVEPRFITRITDSHGETIAANLPVTEQVIAPETAYLVTSLLKGVIDRGTGRRADLGRPAAGKTGTTNDMNDAWFVGYTPQLVAGVWVGFDEKRSLGKGETGGRVAAPIWKRFMERALEDQPILDFPVPAGISFVLINRHTGQRALPGDSSAFLECFRRGTEPRVPPPPEAADPMASDIDPGAIGQRDPFPGPDPFPDREPAADWD